MEQQQEECDPWSCRDRNRVCWELKRNNEIFCAYLIFCSLYEHVDYIHVHSILHPYSDCAAPGIFPFTWQSACTCMSPRFSRLVVEESWRSWPDVAGTLSQVHECFLHFQAVLHSFFPLCITIWWHHFPSFTWSTMDWNCCIFQNKNCGGKKKPPVGIFTAIKVFTRLGNHVLLWLLLILNLWKWPYSDSRVRINCYLWHRLTQHMTSTKLLWEYCCAKSELRGLFTPNLTKP